ncbi:MAG: hypothetical protein AAF911_08515 [Planctomycetota bacterium]
MSPQTAGAAPEPTLKDDPPEEDARAGSSVTGMSGLSDLMQAEPNRKAGDTAVGGQPPPIREAKFASAEAAQNLAQSAASLRQTQRPGAMSGQSRRLAILIIAVLAFGVALAGIGLVLLGGDEGNNVPANTSDTDPAADLDAADNDPADYPVGPPRQPDSAEPGVWNDRSAPAATGLAQSFPLREAG